MKTIKCAGVDLNIYDGPVGITVSGGADSAILLYYLMKHAEDTIHIFSLGNNQRYRRNVNVALQIVETCITLTKNSNVEHHIRYCDVQTHDEVFHMPKQFVEDKRVKVVYNGTTCNPPKEVTDTFKLPVSRPRDPDVKHDVLSFGGVAYTPFANIDKKVIADMYREEMLDVLFKMTRSCEYDPTSNFFENIKDPGLAHCGHCWWCEERKWAFGRV